MNITDKKLIDSSYVDTILQRLYDWMPFKKSNNGIRQDSRDHNGNITTETTSTNEVALGEFNKSYKNTVFSVGIGDSEKNRKNAIEIRKNGMIYIITDLNTNSAESLQNTLSKKGTTICDKYDEMTKYVSIDNLGRLLYLKSKSMDDNNNVYLPGLYLINMSTNGSLNISKIGTTYSSSVDIDQRFDDIELKINDLEKIETRITDIEDWIDEPIADIDLDKILNTDIDSDE